MDAREASVALYYAASRSKSLELCFRGRPIRFTILHTKGAGASKPQHNAYIESVKGKFRDECLNEHWFLSLRHARQVIEDWRQEYNDERPHNSLGYQTPKQFAARFFNTGL